MGERRSNLGLDNNLHHQLDNEDVQFTIQLRGLAISPSRKPVDQCRQAIESKTVPDSYKIWLVGYYIDVGDTRI
jgi:hypothetical protein